MVVDTVADCLTRIRNGVAVQKRQVEVPYSKIVLGIINVLKDGGYIKSFCIKNGKKSFLKIIVISFWEGACYPINILKQISKPGRRVYAKAKRLPEVMNGLGIAILSTSNGIVSNKVAAKKNIGGEILCYAF
ncbi:MAG: 30S ribosomal protein S8 [Cytophagales bacterium]|jgi:small subunit ribosomal protein S8|nr:30S ribosomal protein S8 [Cytophagales bacterium]